MTGGTVGVGGHRRGGTLTGRAPLRGAVWWGTLTGVNTDGADRHGRTDSGAVTTGHRRARPVGGPGCEEPRRAAALTCPAGRASRRLLGGPGGGQGAGGSEARATWG